MKLKSLYDNLDVITFLIDKSGNETKIETPYYKSIFKNKDLNFLEELFSTDVLESSFYKNIIKKVLILQDQAKIKVYLSLLPKRLVYNENVYYCSYKVILEGKKEYFLCLLWLNNNIESNDNENRESLKYLKAAIKVATNLPDFLDLQKEFTLFYKVDIPDLFFNNRFSNGSIIKSILKQFHTFKGNFARFEFYNSIEQIKNLEDVLIKKMNDVNIDCLNNSEIINIFDKYSVTKVMNEELDYIRIILGNDFFHNEDKILISKKALLEFRKNISKILPFFEAQVVTEELDKLSYTTLKELFKFYYSYIPDLAVLYGKIVKFKLTGNFELLINGNYYKTFIKSLVNVFRNMIEHGIEAPIEREEKGKDNLGIISVDFIKHKEFLIISILDDGGGVDIKRLRDVLSYKIGLSKSQEISEDEIVQYIMNDEVSSVYNDSTSNSSRGLGLGAVKNELDKIGGKCSIVSGKNSGTKFTFKLPFVGSCEDKIEKFDLENLGNKIVSVLKSTILSEFKKKPTSESKMKKGYRYLGKHSSQLRFSGNIRGIVHLSISENLLEEFTIKFINNLDLKEYDVKGIETLLLEAVGEILNIVMASVSGQIKKSKNDFSIAPPISMIGNNMQIEYPSLKTYSYSFNFGEERIDLCLMPY